MCVRDEAVDGRFVELCPRRVGETLDPCRRGSRREGEGANFTSSYSSERCREVVVCRGRSGTGKSWDGWLTSGLSLDNLLSGWSLGAKMVRAQMIILIDSHGAHRIQRHLSSAI